MKMKSYEILLKSLKPTRNHKKATKESHEIFRNQKTSYEDITRIHRNSFEVRMKSWKLAWNHQEFLNIERTPQKSCRSAPRGSASALRHHTNSFEIFDFMILSQERAQEFSLARRVRGYTPRPMTRTPGPAGLTVSRNIPATLLDTTCPRLRSSQARCNCFWELFV